MHPILQKLQGGDRRSIGRSEEVVSEVLGKPALFEVLIRGLTSEDAIVRVRASDAMEKVCRAHPEFLSPHKKFLLKLAARSQQKEVRWHLAQVLPRLKLRPKEKRWVVDLLLSYFGDSSRIVKTCAMQALADIGQQTPELQASILVHLQEVCKAGSPAMKARGRKLLADMDALAKRRDSAHRRHRSGSPEC